MKEWIDLSEMVYMKYFWNSGTGPGTLHRESFLTLCYSSVIDEIRVGNVKDHTSKNK